MVLNDSRIEHSFVQAFGTFGLEQGDAAVVTHNSIFNNISCMEAKCIGGMQQLNTILEFHNAIINNTQHYAPTSTGTIAFLFDTAVLRLIDSNVMNSFASGSAAVIMGTVGALIESVNTNYTSNTATWSAGCFQVQEKAELNIRGGHFDGNMALGCDSVNLH